MNLEFKGSTISPNINSNHVRHAKTSLKHLYRGEPNSAKNLHQLHDSSAGYFERQNVLRCVRIVQVPSSVTFAPKHVRAVPPRVFIFIGFIFGTDDSQVAHYRHTVGCAAIFSFVPLAIRYRHQPRSINTGCL